MFVAYAVIIIIVIVVDVVAIALNTIHFLISIFHNFGLKFMISSSFRHHQSQSHNSVSSVGVVTHLFTRL